MSNAKTVKPNRLSGKTREVYDSVRRLRNAQFGRLCKNTGYSIRFVNTILFSLLGRGYLRVRKVVSKETGRRVNVWSIK